MSGHFKAGLDAVRNTKWRNFWTMLGVIIGVTSVVSVVGIGDGIKQQVNQQLHHTGGNVIIVRPSSINGTGNNTLNLLSGFSVSGTLNSQDENVVTKTPGVKISAPLNLITAKVGGDRKTFRSGLVIGTNQNLPALLDQTVAGGSFLTSDTLGNDNVVLGSQAAVSLFNEAIPLGQMLSINGQQFTVTGVMNAFPNTPLSQNADYNQAVFIPYSIAEQLTNNTAPTFQILAEPHDTKRIQQTATAIQKALTKSHGGQSDFSVQTANQSFVTSSSILSLLTELITGIAAISLVVGGIGIMNVMLVSVTERMHEIGIRKAVGATNKQILSQFLVESTMLSFSGGVIGIIASLLIDVALHLFTNLQPAISWQAVVISTVISILIGVIFGSFPALKAARKDPISALRAD